MGFRSMARSNLVPSVRAFSTCPHLFGLEFPLVFLRIEFPCVFQRFSLDERCCLPIAEPDKAAEVLDTEYFTKIGNFIIYIPYFYNLFLIHICTIYIQYSQNLATSTSCLQGIWSMGKEIYLSVGSFPDFLIWKWLLSTWLPDPLVLTANPFYLLSWESIIQRFLIWYPVGNIMTDENLRHLSVLPFVKRWQNPLFFHDGYALRFIVGAFYQIRNPVYHYQMPPYW